MSATEGTLRVPLHGLVRLPFAFAAALLIAACSLPFVFVGLGEWAWATMRPVWGHVVLFLAGVRVHVEGAEHLSTPALLCSNHTGTMDSIVGPAYFPPYTKWVMKKEFARVPILGWACRAGAFFVDRGDSAQARAAMKDGAAGLDPEWSIVIYPEGTRQRDGHLAPFKKGVFHLALLTRLPIVPMACHGGTAVLARGSMVVRPGSIELTVGAPIATDGWTREEADRRMEEIRDAVAACAEASRVRFESRA